MERKIPKPAAHRCRASAWPPLEVYEPELNKIHRFHACTSPHRQGQRRASQPQQPAKKQQWHTRHPCRHLPLRCGRGSSHGWLPSRPPPRERCAVGPGCVMRLFWPFRRMHCCTHFVDPLAFLLLLTISGRDAPSRLHLPAACSPPTCPLLPPLLYCILKVDTHRRQSPPSPPPPHPSCTLLPGGAACGPCGNGAHRAHGHGC